tara:strand:- start:3608 stop:8617 length:5010 start_codon:yes stop_codon:yes gene_type:complete
MFSTHKILPLLFVLILFLIYTNSAFAQTITKATGGGAISADNFGGTWSTLTGPTIQETSPGQLSSGTFRLQAPSGFIWNTAVTPTAVVTSPKSTKITVVFVSITTSEIQFSITGNSGGNPKNNPHQIVFSGIQVRPNQGTPLASGIIKNVGSAAPGGTTSYGDLAMVVGADNQIRVESAANSSGSLIPSQSIEAGQSLTLYANVRDQHGNFKRNQSVSWSTENETGGVTDGDLLPLSGTSTTFTSNLTGTAKIQATSGALAIVPTDLITVTPSIATNLSISTQPSSSSVAGTILGTQPIVQILDTYGNIVTTDNFTQITANRTSGTGALQGTKTVTVVNGVATFTNLSHNVANDIDISFSASGFSDIISNTLTINHAPAEGLEFTTQPSNGNRNAAVPTIEVQVIDAFSNPVDTVGLTVDLTINSGTGNISNGSISTNSSGIASYTTVQFNQVGLKSLIASSTGLSNSPASNNFTIASAGELAGFEILTTSDATIGPQEAGVAFNIKIRAVDGVGALLDGGGPRDEFTGNVDITTTSVFSGATTTTTIGPFVGGVLSSHSVELINSGINQTITATNSAGSEAGSSNSFTISPSSADVNNSLISISESSLITNSGQTSIATVQLKDEFGNLLEGDVTETILISLDGTSLGSIGSTSGNGDGTYFAIITASTSIGTENVTATIDGGAIDSGNQPINYTFDELSTFVIEKTGGGAISTQTAGIAFNIRLTAEDAFGNIVTSFDGVGNTVEITSSGSLSSGSGTTATFTNGVFTSHSVTLTSVGSTTITARKTASSETGTSDSFIVDPGVADPTTSTVTPGISFLQNDGSDNTIITIQLKDAFGNNLNTNPGTVNINKNGASASIATTATYVSNGQYTATLTASSTTETITINANLNGGSQFSDNAIITVTQFNIWEADAGGSAVNRVDWENTSNWSLGSLPTTGQVVVIPSGLSNYPTIDTATPTIDFLSIASGALVTLSGQTITINNDITGDGSFFGSGGSINLAGNSSIANFIAGSSTVNLNGSSTQTIENDFTANILNIQNNVTVTEYLEAFTSLTVDASKMLIMQSGSQLIIFGDLIVNGALLGSSSDFQFGGDISIGGSGTITLSNTSLELNGNTEQQVNGINNIRSFTINNSAGIVINNDIEVTDTLFITNGTVTIESGYSFVSNVKIGNTSNIIAKREISGIVGWRLLSSPLSSTYSDFLDGTITQGYVGSSEGVTISGDSVQPNVLYYDETFSGTDNQRFRAPTSAATSLTAGRGLFVFFFDDQSTATIPDARYNEPLPDTLQIQGAENDGDGTNFTFPVTYTASADTGWNLVGNPFTATIDWDDGNWTKTNMDNAIYIFDPASNDYLTWNGLTGSLGDGKIAPFQGFWVKANGNGAPTLKVNKSSKTTNGTFYKTSNRGEPKLELKLSNGDLSKTTHLSFNEEGRFIKDRFDAIRLLPFKSNSYLELFTILDNGTQLAINNLPRDFGIPIEIPIYINGYKDGLQIESGYELSWKGIEDVPEGWTFELLDRNKKVILNLKKTNTLKLFPSPIKEKLSAHHSQISSTDVSLTETSTAKLEASEFFLRIIPGNDADDLPKEFSLSQNYPNPFNPETTIEFGLPIQSQVNLAVYDILGREVAKIVEGELNAGFYSYNWDASSLSSGVYFYRLVTFNKLFSKKMTLIK